MIKFFAFFVASQRFCGALAQVCGLLAYTSELYEHGGGTVKATNTLLLTLIGAVMFNAGPIRK